MSHDSHSSSTCLSHDPSSSPLSGANVDDDSNSQRTALHEATEGEHTDIAELLLKQSEVNPTIRDNGDNTPYDIAYAKKNEEVGVASVFPG